MASSPFRRRHVGHVRRMVELVEPLDRALRNTRVLVRRIALTSYHHVPLPRAYVMLCEDLAAAADTMAAELAAGEMAGSSGEVQRALLRVGEGTAQVERVPTCPRTSCSPRSARSSWTCCRSPGWTCSRRPTRSPLPAAAAVVGCRDVRATAPPPPPAGAARRGHFEAIDRRRRPGRAQRGRRPLRHAAGPRRARHRPTRPSSPGWCTSPRPRASTRSPTSGPAPPPDSLAGVPVAALPAARLGVRRPAPRPRASSTRGRRHTPVARGGRGVVDPPGPDEVRALADLVLRGVVRRVTSPTRCSAPPRSPAWPRRAGPTRREPRRRGSSYASDLSAARLLTLAEQLEHAGRLEIDGRLA